MSEDYRFGLYQACQIFRVDVVRQIALPDIFQIVAVFEMVIMISLGSWQASTVHLRLVNKIPVIRKGGSNCVADVFRGDVNVDSTLLLSSVDIAWFLVSNHMNLLQLPDTAYKTLDLIQAGIPVRLCIR